jgi:hypothetical protein
MKKIIAAAAGSLGLLAASQAFATITVTSTAPFPPNPPENVLLNANAAGTTILGTTNQTSTAVRFTTSTDTLNATSNGQASITSLDNALNTLNISLTNPNLGFSAFEFNLDSNTTSALTLVFTDQFGHTQTGTQTFNVGANGSNFFDAVSSNGELITNVAVSGANLSSVGQVRLGGVTAITRAVPEPGSWALMIFGFGGIGAAMRARRRQALTA